VAPRARTKDIPPLRWLVGVELARHREAAGLSMTDVAQRVGISKPKLGQMETGRQLQSTTDIVLLLNFYEVEREEIDGLVALTDRAEETTWATGSAHSVPTWFRIYLGLERIATKLFAFEPLLVPGLLHTASYAQAVVGSSLFVRPTDVDRTVALRMARAQRLTDAGNPLEYHTVTTEAALTLRAAEPDTHRAQLQHLLKMAEEPNVTIQLLRSENGYHDAHHGKFVLLDFEEVRSLAYTETVDNALYVQDPDQVHHYAMVADQLKSVALEPDESLALIEAVAASIH
jgi:transcriptional regulator with XRE-family HTH domain